MTKTVLIDLLKVVYDEEAIGYQKVVGYGIS